MFEVLRRSVKVYLLKNTRLVKRLREENGLRKSDEVDAKLLSMIPRNHFKQLTAREIGLLKLIGEYERYVKWKETIRQWMRACPSDLFKECAKRLQYLVKQYARRIIMEVKDNANYATTYRLACDTIGVKDSVEIAILVVRLPLNWKLSRLYGLLGLIPRKSKNNKSYNYDHKLRKHLSKVATSIYLNGKQHGICTDLLKDLENLPPKKVIYRLELRILKILKRAWQQKQLMLAGGQ